MRGGVLREGVVPGLFGSGALGLVIPAGVDLGRDLERRMVPAKLRAGGGDLVLAQRGAVAFLLALLVRRAEADDGLGADQGGFVVLRGGLRDRLPDRLGVVPVHAADHVPAVGLEARRRVVGEPAVHLAVDRDAVVVVDRHQLAQAPGAGQRGDLVRDAFHQAAIAEEHPGVVIDHVMAGAIEMRRQHLFGQREADRVGQALAERAGGGFHSRRLAGFRMAGGLRVQLAEALQLLHRQVETGQVQQRVLQHRAVSVGEHEAVAVGPLRVARVELQEIVPQHLGEVGHAHRHARMTGLRCLHGVHGKGAHGIGKFAAGGHRCGLRAAKAPIVADPTARCRALDTAKGQSRRSADLIRA